jgi:hypothetical protein
VANSAAAAAWRIPRLTLLSRAYCHLCDDMRKALAPIVAEAEVKLVELDVDADRALEAKFGDLVPVLLLGDVDHGVELCHYTLDAARVRAGLAAHRGQTPDTVTVSRV